MKHVIFKVPNDPRLKLYHGVLVRKDRTDDQHMVAECDHAYSHFQYLQGDAVLDLGVNVGGFAVMALPHDIRKYIGVEPDPENMSIAKINVNGCCHSDRAELFLGAASVSTEKTLTFYQTESGNAKCSGTVTPKSRRALAARPIQYRVKNYSIDELILLNSTEIVKMDIEGAEWDWFRKNSGCLPGIIREFAVDLHHASDIAWFDKTILPVMLKSFDLVHAEANTAYEGKKELTYSFPGLGLSGTDDVYAVDAFFRRK